MKKITLLNGRYLIAFNVRASELKVVNPFVSQISKDDIVQIGDDAPEVKPYMACNDLIRYHFDQ